MGWDTETAHHRVSLLLGRCSLLLHASMLARHTRRHRLSTVVCRMRCFSIVGTGSQGQINVGELGQLWHCSVWHATAALPACTLLAVFGPKAYHVVYTVTGYPGSWAQHGITKRSMLLALIAATLLAANVARLDGMW